MQRHNAVWFRRPRLHNVKAEENLPFAIADACRDKEGMGWQVVERRIGKAGPLKRREARQRDWDWRYGEGNWEVGYVLAGPQVSGRLE
jgi:hypothetical protein